MDRGRLVRALVVLGLTLGVCSVPAIRSAATGPKGSVHVLVTQKVAFGSIAERDEPGEDASAAETFWSDRLGGQYNAAWLRRAAREDARTKRAVPAGEKLVSTAGSSSTSSSSAGSGSSSSNDSIQSTTGLLTNSFVALGPKPERMTGCSGCFDYSTTSGRINAIVIDPRTTTNGSIVAYSASDGGGVWKTTTCCTAATQWTPVTDDPLIANISIDTLALDPSDPDTIYAGTGDLNFGSLSMGSQGILKSTNGGASWTTLGSTVFGPVYTEPAGKFPQYDSVGKVRVDPNDSRNVVAGTKKGLFFSYDGGSSWRSCPANSFTTQRQDITGLELTNMGGGVTRIVAAVGTRGFNSPVQYDLDQNGANGIYSATMTASGCPSFTSIASNANGFTFGTAVANGPYTTGASLNAGSGTPYGGVGAGDQLGRIDIAVAPNNPNYIYAQVGSIAPNTAAGSGNNPGCGSVSGCQLGVWASTNGGSTWSFMAGSAGASLRACATTSGVVSAGSLGAGTGDYNQNWYDQGIAVDPNNPDRIFVDTHEVWLATRGGSSFYDTTCGYTGTAAANHVVHTDQHALAFVPGSSSQLMIGNDGGVHATLNANAAQDGVARPAWFNVDGGFNTIEFYDGDLSANFATSPNPQAAGGAQDNMDSFTTFSGSPTGPQQWQGNIGGDGFMASIDGKGGFFYASNNSGQLHRCSSANCTGPNGTSSWTTDIRATSIRNDTQSFVMPFDVFRGNPGKTGNAECGTRCNHLLIGTTRVWESTNVDAGTISWFAQTGNVTKQTLGNRSYINQIHYAPADQTLAIFGTNDGNVEVMRGLGSGTAVPSVPATTTDITGGNAVLPNRPILDVAIDPTSTNTDAAPIIGYAAIGGFNANTPSTPGHVYRVVCDVNCATPVWTDKTGNLPDIPVDSIVPNPRIPQQVFAGTDFGLYFTNDITAASPTWYRFANGLSAAMVWSLTVDRGNTTLGVWTRSRGAYAWPLPTAAIKQDQTIDFPALADGTYGDPDRTLAATATSGLAVGLTASGICSIAGNTLHIAGAGTCSVTAAQDGNIDFNPASVTRSFTVAKASQSVDFAEIADATFGDPDITLGATATSGLGVSYAAAGTCSIVGGSVHISGAGTCTVTASQAGGDNYLAADSVDRSFAIAKAAQTISVGTTEDKTYGDADFDIDATASSSLPVSLAVSSGPCTLTDAHVHIGGAGACVIVASQGGNDDYLAAPDETRSFSIAKANQTIDFGSLDGKTYGDEDFDVSASASSHEPVSFVAAGPCTVDGSKVHLTGAGDCTITASQAGDADWNPAPDVAQTFSIGKSSQSIDFGTLANKTYGDDDFAVSASASSKLDVSFAASGNCSVTDGVVRILGAGSCTVTASQPGNADYDAASDVAKTFEIAKAHQTISLDEIGDKTYGDGDFYVSAAASSGLDISLAVSGNCSLVYGKVSLSGAGSCTVTASQGGNENYEAAENASRTFSIGKSSQTIAFQAIDPRTFGTADFEIDASATSGLSVTLVVASGPCRLSGSIAPATVKITGAGTCVIRASQPGDENYKPAADVSRSFSIAKDNQTITFGALSSKTFGDADFPVSASASSGLAVKFTAAGDCSVANGVVHITGGGACDITASQGGNDDWNPASDVTRSFTIAKASQSITFGTLADKTYGDAPFIVSASATSHLPVSFSATGACSVSGSTVQITGVNTCTITASQAGDANYSPAGDVSRTFLVVWPFGGFIAPVANDGWNDVNAGSTVPLKFSLGGSRGLAIFANGAPQVFSVSCTGTGGGTRIGDAQAPGASGLTYSNGVYQFNWKTDKAWAGTCAQVQLTLADGSVRQASFRFR